MHWISECFTYLHCGLALILVFVGIKMVISDFYKLNPFVSSVIIGFIHAGSIAASFIWPSKAKKISEVLQEVSLFDENH